jgi:hypothetical protein
MRDTVNPSRAVQATLYKQHCALRTCTPCMLVAHVCLVAVVLVSGVYHVSACPITSQDYRAFIITVH